MKTYIETSKPIQYVECSCGYLVREWFSGGDLGAIYFEYIIGKNCPHCKNDTIYFNNVQIIETYLVTKTLFRTKKKLIGKERWNELKKPL